MVKVFSLIISEKLFLAIERYRSTYAIIPARLAAIRTILWKGLEALQAETEKRDRGD